MSKEKSLIVIGGGPGGYVAAIRAAQLGFAVTLIEKEHLGGICLNWGCIPTKALLRSASIYREALHAADFGVEISGKITPNLEKMVARSRHVAQTLSNGIKGLMKKNKVTVIEGHARLLGKGKIQVQQKDGKTQELSSPHIILATGARARILPGFEPDGELIWSYREAMVAKAIPKRLIVVGSGAIGIEFASFYRTLGAEVSVLEVQDRILMAEDEDIAKLAHKSFEKQGMVIRTGVKLGGVTKKKGTISVAMTQGGKTENLEADRMIMAVGIVPNVEEIGLEKTAVKQDRGHIVTDPYLATNEPGLYAIGDVTQGPWLAHKASHEAIICVEKIAGLADVHPLVKEQIPGCTYCHPQIASVGLTEQKAKSLGLNIRVGRFSFVGNGKAIAMGATEGLVKTIINDATGEILGVHMIGEEVTEMIQGAVIGKQAEATDLTIAHSVFPHPTISEAFHESILDSLGRVIHL
jgi:dihydrolipoamide dehydrogenase